MPLREAEFRATLTDLIQRYDAAHETGDNGAVAWDTEFQDLLYDASDDQSRRAFALLELHVRNRALEDDA